MSLSFSKEDVHKHLQDLGYSNISNEQLREFMTDLKRLIRYEEKQKRIEAHLKYARTQSRCDESETTEKGHYHKNKVSDSQTLTRSSTHRSETNELTRSSHTKKVDYIKEIRTKEVIHSYRKNETLGNSTTEEFQIQIKIPPIPSPKILKNSSEDKGSRDKKPSSATGKASRAEFDGGCWEMINQDAIQILPPKPKIPTKPTTSCIKPTFTERQKKDLKRDPVRLHDYYKKQWEKFRLPGDDSHETKELRWAVREWMMGRKPPES